MFYTHFGNNTNDLDHLQHIRSACIIFTKTPIGVTMAKQKIAIIGAGLSGLTAAICLEKNGFLPTIYESGNHIGGRVRSDRYEGVALDYGFQVLLTAYPMTRKYLDYERLELKRFLPGSLIFNKGKRSKIGDPLRAVSFLIPTLFSGVGSLRDKWKIFRLSARLKKKTLQEIFTSPEMTTLQFLNEYGFSKRIIAQFFSPFFTGIFLEEQLNTSSRMFEFVFKMFAEGDAAIPANGMQEIPKQLHEKLNATTFQFEQKVTKVEGGTIYFENGSSRSEDFILIATDPSELLADLVPTPVQWHSSQTLYFKSDLPTAIGEAIIGLMPHIDTLVNNVHYVTDVLSAKGGSNQILSVTVVKEHTLSEAELVSKVKAELSEHCGVGELELIRCDKIPFALPNLPSVALNSRIIKYSETIFLAGDHLANGSINAAMQSGEDAANAILNEIQKRS